MKARYRRLLQKVYSNKQLRAIRVYSEIVSIEEDDVATCLLRGLLERSRFSDTGRMGLDWYLQSSDEMLFSILSEVKHFKDVEFDRVEIYKYQ